MAAEQTGESHADKWDLTCYLRWGIDASIPTWTYSQNSLATSEVPSLNIFFHGTSFKDQHLSRPFQSAWE